MSFNEHARQLSVTVLILLLAAPGVVRAGEKPSPWLDRVLSVPYPSASPPDQPRLQLLYQDYERLGLGTTCMGGPMTIGTHPYKHGLGTHANSRIRIFSPEPIGKFTALAGVDNNSVTNPQNHPIGSVVFVVIAGNRELYRSKLMLAGKEAEKVEVDVGGAKVIELLVTDGGNGSACDWADWADAAITTARGKTRRPATVAPQTTPVAPVTNPVTGGLILSSVLTRTALETAYSTWKVENDAANLAALQEYQAKQTELAGSEITDIKLSQIDAKIDSINNLAEMRVFLKKLVRYIKAKE